MSFKRKRRDFSNEKLNSTYGSTYHISGSNYNVSPSSNHYTHFHSNTSQDVHQGIKPNPRHSPRLSPNHSLRQSTYKYSRHIPYSNSRQSGTFNVKQNYIPHSSRSYAPYSSKVSAHDSIQPPKYNSNYSSDYDSMPHSSRYSPNMGHSSYSHYEHYSPHNTVRSDDQWYTPPLYSNSILQNHSSNSIHMNLNSGHITHKNHISQVNQLISNEDYHRANIIRLKNGSTPSRSTGSVTSNYLSSHQDSSPTHYQHPYAEIVPSYLSNVSTVLITDHNSLHTSNHVSRSYPTNVDAGYSQGNSYSTTPQEYVSSFKSYSAPYTYTAPSSNHYTIDNIPHSPPSNQGGVNHRSLSSLERRPLKRQRLSSPPHRYTTSTTDKSHVLYPTHSKSNRGSPGYYSHNAHSMTKHPYSHEYASTHYDFSQSTSTSSISTLIPTSSTSFSNSLQYKPTSKSEIYHNRGYPFQKSSKQPSASKYNASNSSHDDPEGHYKFKVGEILQNQYKIIQFLGSGTFAKVVKCVDIYQNRLVAIKIIRSLRKYTEAAKVEISVLKDIKERDKEDRYHCIRLIRSFSYKGHVCLVFPLFGISIFDFIKENNYIGFNISQIQHITRQFLEGIRFLHEELRIVHTDLKPENILLVKEDYEEVPLPTKWKKSGTKERNIMHIPKCVDIKIIDFGSAAYERDHHTSIISTRHYRAPEVILGLGWSFPADMWSVGCIFYELLTGDALFQTHDNAEHIAMMNRYFGEIPYAMYKKSHSSSKKFFTSEGYLNWPSIAPNQESIDFVKGLKSVDESLQLYIKSDQKEVGSLFKDLLQKLLIYQPSNRLTASQALTHPFFQKKL